MNFPLADLPGSFWMPPAASVNAEGVDQTFNLILWVNYLYAVPIFLLLFYFAWKFRRKGNGEALPSAHHGFLLEVTWTVIPTIMVVGIFFQGFVQYIGLTTMPEDPYEIQVYAKKWDWTFQYPGGVETSELHIPGGRPVLLKMRSADVMHSLYIPAFRVKMDVIPGRFTEMWFEPFAVSGDDPATPDLETDVPVAYDLFCTEYCGTGHSQMITKVFVHNGGQFEGWLRDEGSIADFVPPCQYGQILWEQKCKSCHSVDGSRGTGPTWQGTFGTEVATSAGTVTVDENYLRESILHPNAKVRDGYQGVMPTFMNQLDEKQLDAIIAYHRTLNPDSPGWQPCEIMTKEEIDAAREAAKEAEAAGGAATGGAGAGAAAGP